MIIWLSEHPRLFGIALGLIMGLAGGYAARGKPPTPAVHAVEDTASQKAVATQTATVDSKGPEKITTTVEEFGPPSPNGAGPRPAGDYTHWAGSTSQLRTGAAPSSPDASTITRRTVTVTERGPEVVEVQASKSISETAQTRLDLTVTPPPEKPGWAVGAGVSLNDKALRLELDRRLFGNLWLGASVVPARREVGVGLRMEW